MATKTKATTKKKAPAKKVEEPEAPASHLRVSPVVTQTGFPIAVSWDELSSITIEGPPGTPGLGEIARSGSTMHSFAHAGQYVFVGRNGDQIVSRVGVRIR